MAPDTKDPRALAELSGAVYSKTLNRSIRAARKLRNRQLANATEPAREAEAQKRQLQNVRVYYVNPFAQGLLDFSESVRINQVFHEEKRQIWKLASVSYDGFMRWAFSTSEAQKYFDPNLGYAAWEEGSWETFASLANAFLEFARTDEPAELPARNSIRAQLISTDEQQAQCWMEVVEGMRVKATIPVKAIRGLELTTGGEFLWDVENKCAFLQPSQEPESAERQRIRSSLDALKEEFHQDLKHRQTGLEQ